MKRLIPLLFLLFTADFADAQKIDSIAQRFDSTELQQVIVSAFSLQSKWKDVPAAVVLINEKRIQQLNNSSLVPVMNSMPGIRMEERSPGSYRLSIRGSLLRSPFGVRNIKTYWNDIPLTDAGGNTYLNLVDWSQLQSIEIIKGPASSLYGANTGGAVLLRSNDEDNRIDKHSLQASVSGGSYGLFREQAAWRYKDANFYSVLNQSHQQSDGYRQQSAMRRDAVNWNGSWQINPKEKLSFLAFYTDLFYQTPGGLTQQQMDADPKLARPSTSAVPGSVEQKAAIYNKTVFAGTSLHSEFNSAFDNTTTVSFNHTGFKNPFINNYEIRDEWNYGGRTTFRYHGSLRNFALQWLAGAEWQQNNSHVDVYGNKKGVIDTVQFKDALLATQYFLFTQLNMEWKNDWVLQLGLSSNKQLYQYRRLTDAHGTTTQQSDKNLVAPRISILRKWDNGLSVYGIVAKGFSPPSLAEIRPSDGNYYGDLEPEWGWNYEAGIKGTLLQNRLLFDASFYYFGLKDAIVRRTNASGAEYFINAGGTTQKGVEIWTKAYLVRNNSTLISSLSLWNSYSYQPYRFDTYRSANGDFSGNQLTGVPRNINVSGLDMETRKGWYANLLFNYTSAIPLDDANDAYAKAYHLLQSKIGYQQKKLNWKYNVFAGVDNILNEAYSLGNDINAFGKRFYNPASGRNFFVGIEVAW